MEFLSDYGCWGLFLSAFCAATILPLSSEIVLVILLNQGLDPVAAVAVATCGNVLGSVTNYGLGFFSGQFILSKLLKTSDQKIKAAFFRFKKYGIFSLLFAWVPLIGDPLTVVAGMLRIHLLVFVILVGTGKCLRYVFIAWAAMVV